MIKATELRLGNWIISAGTGELHPVQVNINNLRQLVDAPEYGAVFPITPEILDKAGFIIVFPGCYSYTSGKMNFVLWPHAGYPKVSGLCYRLLNVDPVWVDSLHKLQNLYFALTGEELDIKL